MDPVDDFSIPVPEDTYLCRVKEVEETKARTGVLMWKLQLKILETEYQERVVFDNLVFTPKALPRVRLFCDALGLDTTGEVLLTPDMVKGKTCQVVVRIEEYENDYGQNVRRNVVPYAGFEPASNVE